MSTFGDGSFKQDVYEQIGYSLVNHDLKPSEAVAEVLEVLQYILNGFDYESEVYKKAKEDARKELLEQIGGVK